MKFGKRSSRRRITVGVEAPHPDGFKVLIPLAVVPRNTSRYTPHQGEREKARRRKQQEQ